MFACSPGGAETRSLLPSPRPLPAPPPSKSAADPLSFPVYLVEPARDRRVALTRHLADRGYQPRPFATLEDLGATLPELAPGCLIFDLVDPERMPAALRDEGGVGRLAFPAVLRFATLDPEAAVTAVRLGAADLLHRGAPMSDLVDALRRAGPLVRRLRQHLAERRARKAVDSLSKRERQVMECVMLGLSNKETARTLGVSHRTIEMHRGRLHRRLGTTSLAELLALAWRARAADARWP